MLPDFFVKKVLERLDRMDRTMFAEVGKVCRAAVLTSGLPRLPKSPVVRLWPWEFCTSVERLFWARANGLQLNEWTCADVAKAGNLPALKWLREQGCPWDEGTTAGYGWAPGGAEVGMGAPLPVERDDECIRRCGWAS